MWEQASDLSGHDELVTGTTGESRAKSLGKAKTVVRRGVEQPDPALPGAVDGCRRNLMLWA